MTGRGEKSAKIGLAREGSRRVRGGNDGERGGTVSRGAEKTREKRGVTVIG
jgi:hypothetical protein